MPVLTRTVWASRLVIALRRRSGAATGRAGFTCPTGTDESRPAALALLNLPNPPTAVFSTNNVMTLGVIAALQSRGVRIPEDVALVGFDDFDWAIVLRPRLTTVGQPTYDIGKIAAQMLVERIEHRVVEGLRRVVLPTRLLVRESCGGASLAAARPPPDGHGQPEADPDGGSGG